LKLCLAAGEFQCQGKRKRESTGVFRLIFSNPGIGPISPGYNLLRLELARQLAMEHKIEDARREYQGVLAAWKSADPDLSQPAAARSELADLR
jgi:hypothetical protein